MRRRSSRESHAFAARQSRSTVASDTVATRDLPDATGGATVTADAINRITLAALSDRFAWIVPKAALIR